MITHKLMVEGGTKTEGVGVLKDKESTKSLPH